MESLPTARFTSTPSGTMASAFDFHSPWTPGPFLTNARSYAQWMASFGNDSQRIFAELKKKFAEVNVQSLGRMANAALAFAGKLEDMMTRGKTFQMPRSEIPRNTNLPEAYRAVVTVRLRDPNCSQYDRSPECTQYLTVALDFTYNPTWGDIKDAAKTMAKETLPQSGSPRAQAIEEWKIMDYELVALERRS